MPIEPRFMFTTGLKEPMIVPAGTLRRAQEHVQHVESTLGLVVEKYLDNPARWRDTTPTVKITDKDLCAIALEHDTWIDWLWTRLAKWHESPPTGETEVMTPEDAATFWHGTRKIKVPVGRWDRHYCRKRMEQMYEIMRGRPTAGFNMGSKPLTPEQASSMIWLVGEFLDINPGQIDMAAPKEWNWDRKVRRMKLVQLDEIQPSNGYDGDGYEWCERCGAVATDSEGETNCPRRKSQCPVKRDRSY